MEPNHFVHYNNLVFPMVLLVSLPNGNEVNKEVNSIADFLICLESFKQMKHAEQILLLQSAEQDRASIYWTRNTPRSRWHMNALPDATEEELEF